MAISGLQGNGYYIGTDCVYQYDMFGSHSPTDSDAYSFSTKTWGGNDYIPITMANFGLGYLLKDSTNWTIGNLTTSEMAALSIFLNIEEVTE